MNFLISSKVVGEGFEAKWEDKEVAVVEGDDIISKLKRFWLWLTDSGGDWVDTVKNSGFKRRYSIYFGSFRKTREWFILVDTGFLTLFALISSFDLHTRTACIVNNGCLAFSFFMYVIVFLYLRPFSSLLDTAFYMVISILQFLTATFSLSHIVLNDALPWPVGGATSCILISSSLFLVKTLVDLGPYIRTNVKDNAQKASSSQDGEVSLLEDVELMEQTFHSGQSLVEGGIAIPDVAVESFPDDTDILTRRRDIEKESMMAVEAASNKTTTTKKDILSPRSMRRATAVGRMKNQSHAKKGFNALDDAMGDDDSVTPLVRAPSQATQQMRAALMQNKSEPVGLWKKLSFRVTHRGDDPPHAPPHAKQVPPVMWKKLAGIVAPPPKTPNPAAPPGV